MMNMRFSMFEQGVCKWEISGGTKSDVKPIGPIWRAQRGVLRDFAAVTCLVGEVLDC